MTIEQHVRHEVVCALIRALADGKPVYTIDDVIAAARQVGVDVKVDDLWRPCQ